MRVREVLSMDPKASSMSTLRALGHSEHHALSLESFLNKTAVCAWHETNTCLEDECCAAGPPTIYIAGFPCAPYSTQRDGRHGENRPSQRLTKNHNATSPKNKEEGS